MHYSKKLEWSMLYEMNYYEVTDRRKKLEGRGYKSFSPYHFVLYVHVAVQHCPFTPSAISH